MACQGYREDLEETGAGSQEGVPSFWCSVLLGYPSVFLVARSCWWKGRGQEKDLITCLISRASHSEKATHRFQLITLVPDVCTHTPRSEHSHEETPAVASRGWNYLTEFILAHLKMSLQWMIIFMFLFRKAIQSIKNKQIYLCTSLTSLIVCLFVFFSVVSSAHFKIKLRLYYMYNFDFNPFSANTRTNDTYDSNSW